MLADKQTEEIERLRAELTRMHVTLNSIASCIYTKDLSGRYTFANQATCDFFGLPLEAILGKTDNYFFPNDSVETVRESDRIAAASSKTFVESLTDTSNASGKTRYFVSTKAPLFDEQGQLIGISGVSTDVTEQRGIEARLEESRRLLDIVLDNVDANIYMKDSNGRYLYANQRVLDAVHLTQEQALGHTDAELFPPEMAQSYKAVDDLVFSSGQPQQAEELLIDENGNKTYYWSKKLRVSATGKPDFLIGFSTDITPIKRSEQALVRSEARFRALFESSSEAVVVIARTQFIDCNPAALTLLGVGTKAEFLRLTPADLSPPLQPCGTASAIRAAELIEEAFQLGRHKVEWVVQRYDNGGQISTEAIVTAIRLDDGPALLITLRDLTERKRQEEQIARLAFYDPLTQLPNRRLLFERLSQSLMQHQRSHQHGCLIYLDLDNFKPLNDHHGHVAGDHLLQEVGRRLVSCLRAQDTVARLGGDEFVALLIGLDPSFEVAKEQALLVAEKIRQAIALPYHLALAAANGSAKNVEHRCTASLGVVVFRPTDTSVDDILRRADDAMYLAKSEGRNRACF